MIYKLCILFSDGRMISSGELLAYYRTTLNYQTVSDIIQPSSTKRVQRRASVEVLMDANPLLKAPKEGIINIILKFSTNLKDKNFDVCIFLNY